LKHLASLDDLAAMIRAALALYDATGEADYLAHAVTWIGDADRHHWDGVNGGYFFTANDSAATDGTPLICRAKTAGDNATPSGNGMMVGNLARLYLATGDDNYRRRAEAQATAFAGEIGHNFFPLPTLLNGIETLKEGIQIAIVGPTNDPATAALRRAVYTVSLPDRVLLHVRPGDTLPPDHVGYGKTMIDGRPAAYVCRRQSCAAPVTDPTALIAQLQMATPKQPA
jgi:uncharacterized protein YyaL (SSP411 family)